MRAKKGVKFFSKVKKKLGRELLVKKKRIYQTIQQTDEQQQKILLIVGCQRSGTTMMLRLFTKDLQSRVFGEFSTLSSQDPAGIRLNPLPEVLGEVREVPANFIVMKPLVESQHTASLLDYLPSSKAIWMYRHYKDVASSNLKNFGEENGLDDLRPIVEQKTGDWRSEKVSPAVRQTVQQYFSDDMHALDAAALFWWVRNSLYFDHNFNHDDRIKLMRYQDLVTHPDEKMEEIYHFAGRHFPGKDLTSQVSTASVGKGKVHALSPEIESMCEVMLEKLDTVYQKQYYG
jgi:hypothetical protein